MITIIPAIDIINGQCVRLTKGEFDSKKVYFEDPLAAAMQFEQAGIKRLHMVDLDGARQKKIVNWKVLENVSSRTNLVIDFGGGIQSDEDIQTAFDCGAEQITAGSIAVKNKSLVIGWLKKYGAEKIILGADVKDNKIAVSGWQEVSQRTLTEFLKEYYGEGFRRVISTDVSKDGVLQGPAFEMYRETKEEFPELYLIASGGVSKIEDVKILDEMGIDGVIIGKAIYEGKVKLEELKPYLC